MYHDKITLQNFFVQKSENRLHSTYIILVFQNPLIYNKNKYVYVVYITVRISNRVFAAERLQKIRQMTLEYKRVDVSRLSKFFSVSEVTIRKDLEQLENEGFLIRTHGGAILNEGSSTIDGFIEPMDSTDLARKQTIGTLVSQIVDNGDLIFLGAGTTCTEIARNLKTKTSLTVITNNISAAVELSMNQNISIITTGGDFVRKGNTFSLIGTSIIDFLDNRFLDKTIISTDGASFKAGFSVQNDVLAQIGKKALENAEKRIICITSDKFNKNAFASMGPITAADIVVTDEAAPEEYIKYLFENKIKVFNAYDIENI